MGLKKLNLLLISLLMGGIFLTCFASQASSHVVGTPHDLTMATGGGSGGAPGFQFPGTDEPCVFCHTPHIGTGNPINAPIWNRTVPVGPFQMYDSANSATFDMGPSVISAPSSLCMSCHNGVAAMNVVYNTPGPGSTGIIDDGGAFTRIGDIWYPGSMFGVVKNISENDPYGAQPDNLANDHPVSFAYSPALDKDDNGFPARTVVNGRGFINGASGAKYPLYGTQNDRFECSTCHAVHDTVDYGSKGLIGGQVFFLRATNEASAMCIDCHTKR